MLASLIAGLATGETVAALRRTRRALIAYCIAAVFAAFGFGFLLLALFVHVARRVGLVEASLWFGGGFILLSLLVVVVHRGVAGLRRRSARRQRNRDFTKVAVAAGIALAPVLLRSRVGIFALAAPLIASVAYSIYRENAGEDSQASDDRD